MRIPFIAKIKNFPWTITREVRTEPLLQACIQELKTGEYQAVAGGPQVQNDPQG
jgi:hypothetical protein